MDDVTAFPKLEFLRNVCKFSIPFILMELCGTF